jgi:hypothetical protein
MTSIIDDVDDISMRLRQLERDKSCEAEQIESTVERDDAGAKPPDDGCRYADKIYEVTPEQRHYREQLRQQQHLAECCGRPHGAGTAAGIAGAPLAPGQLALRLVRDKGLAF